MKKIILLGLLLTPITGLANFKDQQLLLNAKQNNSIVQIDASNWNTGKLNIFLARAKTMGVKVQVINNGNTATINRNTMIINRHGASQILTPNKAKNHLQKMKEKVEKRRNRFN